MKSVKTLKTVVLVLIIILITIVSLLGINNLWSVGRENLVKDYKLGMDTKWSSLVTIKVDDTVNEEKYDSEGNLVTNPKEGEIYTTVEKPVNAPDVLNKENYKKSKEILQKRLESMDCSQYTIRQNEEEGNIEVELLEDDITGYILQALNSKGTFQIIDAETKEVLLDNSYVKNARSFYATNEYGTTSAYLDIQFNDEGKTKLEEISKTYVKTTEGEGENAKTTEKKVTVKVDEQELSSTYFSETLSTGRINISIGNATTDAEALRAYGLQAAMYASIIKHGELPIVYTIEDTAYQISNVNETIIISVVMAIVVIEALVLLFRFKLRGILGAILQVGFIPTVLLIVRYTNVFITMEGVFALVLVSIINFIFLIKILDDIKNKQNNIKAKINEATIAAAKILAPLFIVSIIFSFINWIEITSFGMTMFWGLIVCAIYNQLFTKTIFNSFSQK